MTTNDTLEAAEQEIDNWRGGLCPTCQQPSDPRFCSEKCRKVWWKAYTTWLKSEGKYQSRRVAA